MFVLPSTCLDFARYNMSPNRITNPKQAGNTIDSIRRWIGHEDPKTTQDYVELSADQICTSVLMPWIKSHLSTKTLNSNVTTICTKDSVSCSSVSSDTEVENMQLEVTQRICKEYASLHDQHDYLVKNILTDVQRMRYQEWRDGRASGMEWHDEIDTEENQSH